ncbi:hypothetical protein VIN01S_27130 [Vibrio inusitatus NBRC 102082]|uniref:DUF4136 domain-containing protein n=2 Tax=Vibrio inusitatus TaxID=413402 RepID=A0A4Y3HXK8_9VIBR|nr:hypothetical protein VIN01S_27130 [Vibrio inusitatus NBRC 102082]
MLLSACVTSTPERENNFAVGVVSSGDFQFISKNMSTYAWHPNSGKAFIEEKDQEQSLRQVFDKAIENELAKKGYFRVELSQSPDFVVGYGLALESQLSDDMLFSKTQLSTGIPADDFHNSDEKGSLVIFMFNFPLLEPKWRALAQSGADLERDPEEHQQQISRYVDTILREMPTAN